MGKQVEFFMTIEDEQDFLIGLDQFGPVKIIYNTFADQSKMQIDTLPPVGTTVYDADLSLLNPQISRSIKQKFVPSQNCYWTDVSESEVVQFNRCRMVKDWLASGRLWFDERTNAGDKSAEFVHWANAVLKWFRRKYKKHGFKEYVAPHALELARTGKLNLGPSDEATISLEERKRIFGVE